MNKELTKLIDACRGKVMSRADVDAQRISFAYGNAPKDDKGTRQTVIQSLEIAE